MPDEPRRPRLRRTAFATALVASVAAFAGSLSGIATTQGKLRPGGDAARIEQRQHHSAPHGCPGGRPARSDREV